MVQTALARVQVASMHVTLYRLKDAKLIYSPSLVLQKYSPTENQFVSISNCTLLSAATHDGTTSKSMSRCGVGFLYFARACVRRRASPLLRPRSPLQLVGLEGLDKSQGLCAPVRPVQLISPSSRNPLAGLQKVARYGSPVRSTAQIIRAFLLATATVARLKPRRSRSWLTH